MEWVVETVLPREVRKLISAVEEKYNQIQVLELRNEAHQQKPLRLNEEIDDLIKTGTYPVVEILTTLCVSLQRIARRHTHTTLFDVNIDSLKTSLPKHGRDWKV